MNVRVQPLMQCQLGLCVGRQQLLEAGVKYMPGSGQSISPAGESMGVRVESLPATVEYTSHFAGLRTTLSCPGVDEGDGIERLPELLGGQREVCLGERPVNRQEP